ncbi:Lipase [Nesidiocoris tenuis]|uniref:Lipase n=1 Tax=Nesidiocoris tenuis TaxID=355587 RepID=A0ABN7AQS7_9HEMI|nr:Lipase [Nesidiocoris tenuis]
MTFILRSIINFLVVLVYVNSASINSTVNFTHEDDGWATQVVFENGTALPNVNDQIANFTSYKGSISNASVSFYLYTRNTLGSPSVAQLGDSSLFGGNIDVSKPVKILIHGYYSGKDKFFAKTIREAYLNEYHYNIINVDWSVDAHSVYWTARNDVPAVGIMVAQFIDQFCAQTGLRPEQLHVIGHSLGAHIAGVAGVNVKSGKLMRVTGLDPAGPMFSVKTTQRIKPESATFVDVIHTCGTGLGLYDAVGHVDFYPNRGKFKQPGCGYSFGTKRAIILYAESISVRDGFVGVKCDSYAKYAKGDCRNSTTSIMGESAPFNSRGRFWLRTASSPPYGLGPYSEMRNGASSSMTPVSFLAVVIWIVHIVSLSY